jgi:hypothetical protein
MLVRLAPLTLLVLGACDSAQVQLDGKKDRGGSDTDDTAAAVVTSPFAGHWTGTMDGHAQFADDWDTAPYCSGDLTTTVADDGSLTGQGDCVILWGPYVDLAFQVNLTGSFAEDNTATVAAAFVESSGQHQWDDVTAIGTADATFGTASARGDTLYYPSGMDPIAAFIVVELTATE